MSLLIKNGRIVTASDEYVADILCDGEVIEEIAPHIDAKRAENVIDAAGKYVFPGFIDPHVHIYLPFMGTYARDTYATASKAALVGGTTSLIEMCCPARSDEPLASYELWLSKAAESACDYTFHMGVSRLDDSAVKQLCEIVNRGIASFKIFLAYKGAFGINDEELFGTLKLARELGVIVTAHCENETLVSQLQAKLISEGKTGPEWQNASRPPRVEAEGVHHLMTFAEMTGAHVYCVHTSCREALEAVQQGQLRGVHAWVESVIPHFVLDKSYTEKPGFEGSKYVMSPPLRDASQHDALWAGLRSRLISTVGTDHAPFDFSGQKDMGKADFTKIPNGIPSIEDRVNILYTHGVCRGRIDLNTFVDAASTKAAKLFGLYPRKGTIQVGSDADLVVYDPTYRGKLSVKSQEMAVDYNAFEGWEIEGRPTEVTVRGKLQVKDGKFVGDLGHGKLLTRKPTHF